MSARLIHLIKNGEEGIVIDTADMSDEQIESEYGLEVSAKITISQDGIRVMGWPTDRMLVAE